MVVVEMVAVGMDSFMDAGSESRGVATAEWHVIGLIHPVFQVPEYEANRPLDETCRFGLLGQLKV